jgi:hypothetical protein
MAASETPLSVKQATEEMVFGYHTLSSPLDGPCDSAECQERPKVRTSLFLPSFVCWC